MPTALHRDPNGKFISTPPHDEIIPSDGNLHPNCTRKALSSWYQQVRWPTTFQGFCGEPPHHLGERSQWLQTPTPGTNQPTAKFMPNLLSQELHALKRTPVENFGAPEAIISMHDSTKKR